MKKIIRINCKTGQITEKPEGEIYKKLGGRSLTSSILFDEVDPSTDALGAGNKLIFACMLISGTPISTVNRISVGAKSPLTGGIKEANAGGTATFFLSQHGIKAIILENIPTSKKNRILLIRADGTISLEDATNLTGKGNYDVFKLVKEAYGDKVSIISNGIAGERGYSNSSIQVSEFGIDQPCRAAARGGLGAVMGSKGIKAIVIQKAQNPYTIEYADQDRFNTALKAVNKTILNLRGALSDIGTATYLAATIPSGIIPYKNYSGELFSQEEKEKYNVNTMVNRIRNYGGSTCHACQPGCIIKCSSVLNDEEGKFLTAGFEYETMGMVGPNCKIFDIDVVARIDRFCDDFGFDTIEFGASIAVYMEAGKLDWSDGSGLLKLLDLLYKGREIADDFGMGTQKLGMKYGVKHIPTVKGQSLAAYDPRNLKGTGMTYGISPMGADHTAGGTISNQKLSPQKKEGQLETVIGLQGAIAACDSNVCLFAWKSIITAGADYANAVNATLGLDWTFNDLLSMGNVTITKEREFNRLAGITPDQDKLPDFFYEEASETGTVFDIDHNEVLEKWHGIAAHS